VLRAGRDGRAQIQLSDGTLVSLSADSDIRLDAYRHDGTGGAPDLAAFTIFRGSARLLAGGKRSAGSSLRIGTPAALLTAQSAELLVTVGRGMQASVGGGQVEVRNDAGRLTLGPGQRAFVKDRATPPILVGTIVPAPVTPATR
jgi:ferric-dicitrate binding protein FerR (iron transport regulator)